VLSIQQGLLASLRGHLQQVPGVAGQGRAAPPPVFWIRQIGCDCSCAKANGYCGSKFASIHKEISLMYEIRDRYRQKQLLAHPT
jgi:hypothetical protein